MLTHRSARALVLVMLAGLFGLMLCMSLGFIPSRNDPFQAPYIDNKVHSIAANSDTWFRFDYAINSPTRTLVTLTMVNGVQSGPGFEVWAPENITEWWTRKPTGKGMVQAIDCVTGTLMGGGQCQSKDLIWIGAFGGKGTYYVRVINNNPSPMNFLLTVQGESVTLPTGPAIPPAATPAIGPGVPAPARTPTMVAVPTPYDDPYHAAPLDGQVHTLPGNSATWYQFDYGVPGDFQYHPQVGLRLIGAAGTGVGFQVWSPERLTEWWLGSPVGRGTQEFAFACESQPVPTATPFPTNQPTPTETPTSTPQPTATPGPEPICTHTPTNDLTWFGAFGGPGTYYVRVVNTTTYVMNYQLVMW